MAFITNDIHLAAALTLNHHQLEKVVMGSTKGKANFVFTQTDALTEAIEEYWKHKFRVDPVAFSEEIKHLKNRIYSLSP